MKKDWKIKKLGDICEFRRGLTYSKNDEVENSSNAVLRSNNIDLITNRLDLSEIKYISDKIKIDETKKVKRDSLLICTANGSKAHLGKVALIDDDYDFAFGGFMGLLIPSESVYPRFFYYALISENYKKFIKSLSDGANINNLKFQDLSRFEVPVPPLEEQKRIVKILDEKFAQLETIKAASQTNLQNAKDLFQSQLTKALSSKTNNIVVDLFDIKTGKLNSNAAVPDGKYPFFTCSREVFAINTYAFDCDAILLAGNNASGDFNVKHYCGKFNAYQRTYVITVKNSNETEIKLLYYVLENYLKQLKNMSVGANTRFLKLGMIQNLEYPALPLPEQKRIVKELDSLSEKVRQLQEIYTKQIANCDELKQAYLQKAFEGEL